MTIWTMHYVILVWKIEFQRIAMTELHITYGLHDTGVNLKFPSKVTDQLKDLILWIHHICTRVKYKTIEI
jgi:hypothetical protein